MEGAYSRAQTQECLLNSVSIVIQALRTAAIFAEVNFVRRGIYFYCAVRRVKFRDRFSGV